MHLFLCVCRMVGFGEKEGDGNERKEERKNSFSIMFDL